MGPSTWGLGAVKRLQGFREVGLSLLRALGVWTQCSSFGARRDERLGFRVWVPETQVLTGAGL